MRQPVGKPRTDRRGERGEQGQRDETGDAHKTKRPWRQPSPAPTRENVTKRRWRCDRGCGKWFHAARDTMNLEFKAFYGITELPPKELMDQAKGPWADYFKARASAGDKA